MMKQATVHAAPAAKWDVANELSIYAQAIWHMASRSLARSFGFAKKGKNKGQARYKHYDRLPASVKKCSATAAELPAGTLTEIRSVSYLSGPCSVQAQSDNLRQGLKQMLPALAGLCEQRWLVLVTPPCLPSVEDLRQAGINPSRVLVVHSDGVNGLAVLEKTLRSGTCGAVLAWLEKGDVQTLDRLRQAAEAGNAWGVLFRTTPQGKQAAPVQLSPVGRENDMQLKVAINE